MRIREAESDDALVLATVHIESWHAAYTGLVPDQYLAALDAARRAEGFRRELAEGRVAIDIAECEGGVVGFVTYGPSEDADLIPDDAGEIRAIYLKPVWWRTGIGRLLCAHAERALSSTGYRLAVLWVLRGNSDACAFYQAMGFHADGAHKMANYGIPLEVVRYRKPLAGAG